MPGSPPEPPLRRDGDEAGESGVTTPKPTPGQRSDEGLLLEQWAFLDRLVERQAAQLRAGFQDSEEAEQPELSLAEVDALRRQLEELRGELHRAQAARQAAEAQARRSRDELAALAASYQQLLADAERARRQQTVLREEVAAWRRRAETETDGLTSQELRAQEELAETSRRLREAVAAEQRAAAGHSAAMEALRGAQLEVESLRSQLASARRGFWRFGRR